MTMTVIARTSLVVLSVIAPSGAEAATITAASCSASHVQAAMNQASAGDTVLIPAGTCNWTTTVSWSAPANVKVLGAGSLTTVGGGDVTIIQDNVASGSPLLSITTNASGTFRLAGLTIRGGTGSIKESGMLLITGRSTQVRLDHFRIRKDTYTNSNAGKLIYVGGRTKGVIDHARFDHGADNGWIHVVNGDIGASDDHGDTPWSEPTGFGTSDFIFIEDSQFVGTVNGDGPGLATATDCHTAGKFVFRYNTGINVNVAQTHPTGHAGDDRGCRAHELYGNTMTATFNPVSVEPMYSFEYNNSGPSMIWGNSLNNVYKNIVYLNICRQDSACGYNPPYGGWGVCGGGSVWDQNSNSTGYPCIDQPGRGQGDLLRGTFPGSKINVALGTAAWPRQALEPIYEWLTTGGPATGWGGAWFNNGASPQVQQNRDIFFHHGNSGCNAGAASCTTGVGVGTLAQRPSTCTLNVAYWATDQGEWNSVNGSTPDGQLYRCTSTNTWTLYYKPHTYPHPLVQGQTQTPPIPPSPPRAPTNVRIIR
jgi:hypothetical protein